MIKKSADSAEIDARGLFCGVTKIFRNHGFSHRLTTMLELVVVRMPTTALLPDVKQTLDCIVRVPPALSVLE